MALRETADRRRKRVRERERPVRTGAPTRGRARRLSVTLLVLALLATAATGAVAWFGDGEGKRVTAYFDRAVGVYEGSDLRILGVKVGTVRSVEPRGKQVRVTLALDEGVKVPADARAVVIAPSLVSDRYVQLTPAYKGGPQLDDAAVLPAGQNATPMEVDQLYASVSEISDALGPEGANSDGALSGLLDTGAANLDGNGAAIGDSIEQFGKATKTLNGSSEDFFDTVTHLQSFTSMLKKNDKRVRTAERQLADVNTFLSDDKENLGKALKNLSTALGDVKGFIKDNRASLKKNVDKLAPLTRTLVDQRNALAETLDTAPLAAGNLVNAYNPGSRTLDNRADINELSMGGPLLPEGPRAGAGGSTTGLEPVGPSARKALPGLPLPAVGTVYGSKGGRR